jgi:transcriptional regulator GlxA family with amidase domain
MQIAIVLFEHCTALDAVGPYEVLSRWPDVDLHFVGEHKGSVRTDTEKLALNVDATYDEIPEPDVIMVPGGYGQRDHREGSALVEWLRVADQQTTWTTSACTGSLILASAGLLTGRRVTTHWLALDDLAALGAIPTEDRVVFDGKYVTAAGVSAGIDMALTLTSTAVGEGMAQIVQLGLEYDPQPPFPAGGPHTAPQFAVDAVTAVTAVRDLIV